ncbi:hypothetical protein [Fluviicola sp.]|uniref:hypothetical protein n=1 Tax=Fluviicola sp. TaxID=1917219 RepID=UPI003D2DDACA
MEKFYKKIVKPLSIVFACFGLLIVVDYFLPRDTSSKYVEDLTMDSSHQPKYNASPICVITIDNTSIRTNSEACSILSVGDKLVVDKTQVLRKITSVCNENVMQNRIDLYVAPYNYFPLFPLLFILPLIFNFSKGENVFLMASRPLSVFLSFISLLMTLF